MSTLLTEEDVAKQLHVSVASLRRWRIERRGPQFIKVGSLVRYRPEELGLGLRPFQPVAQVSRRDGHST